MPEQFETALRNAVSQRGQSLYDISFESQVLLTFLRQINCIFCREQIEELARLQRPLEVGGVRVAFVHMEPEELARPFFESFGLGDAHRFRDSDLSLYRIFDLQRGRIGQVFGLPVLLRILRLVAAGKGKFAKPSADDMQMPGLFLLHEGRIQRAFRPERISDKPDYAKLADCTVCDIDFVAGGTD